MIYKKLNPKKKQNKPKKKEAKHFFESNLRAPTVRVSEMLIHAARYEFFLFWTSFFPISIAWEN